MILSETEHRPDASPSIPDVQPEQHYPQHRRPTQFDRAARCDLLAAATSQAVYGTVDYRRRVMQRLRCILATLEGHDGDTWQARWAAFEKSLPAQTGAWLAQVMINYRDRSTASAGLWMLAGLDVVRPSFEWATRERMRNPYLVGWIEARSADEWNRFQIAFTEMEHSTTYLGVTLQTLGRMMLCTGAKLSDLTADDLIGYHVAREAAGMSNVSGIQVIWRALRAVGWLKHESAAMPFRARSRGGQKSPQELVDRYGVRSPHREVFIEYLKARSANITYSTLVGLTRKLVRTFWCRIVELQPDLSDFAVSRPVIDEWLAGLKAEGRSDNDTIVFEVRAFYFDMAKWAVDDSYWAPWAVRSPINSADARAAVRRRRRRTEAMQQQTRELAPYVPRLVAQAHADLRRDRQMLADTRAAQLGDCITVDGAAWRVLQRDGRSPRRLQREGCNLIRPDLEEDRSFWTWACLEVLRHSGVRIEEMLEMTHMAIQQHRVPKTGEVVPLVHIPPSKTDTERLLVASPELMHALSEIVRRVRDDDGHIPLTRRWDPQERSLASPLPNLFVRRTKQSYNQLEVISGGCVRTWLNRLAAHADLIAHNEPVHFTPHDFRRLFATDALASGLPPHIVQILMGHKSIATTQGYAAVYPKDVIQAHRTFIDLRRTLRPSEEYREPTPDEWDQFEDHFVQRRVSLGSCSRAWGTSCPHEHACVRCSLLRPDPEQIDRLRDIIRNLGLRIKEAEEHHWQGEVDGLKSTLTAAESKLAQMERSANVGRIDLGMPKPRTLALHADSENR